MHQHLTERKTHAENMQISFYFCRTCICLKILENIQISVSMIDRLDITDEYSVKCEFILKTVIFNEAALNISLRKFWKCNILWFSYLAEGFRMRPKVWSTLKAGFPVPTVRFGSEKLIECCPLMLTSKHGCQNLVGVGNFLHFLGTYSDFSIITKSK